MDPRIADYIRAHRRRFTREAIRQKLIDAGHDPGDIDATWAALASDPDDTAGEGFWGRFALIVIGLNAAVFLLVVLATGMLNVPVLAVVLAIVLAIGALIAWGIVALTGPTKMGRTTAMVIGVSIPLLFALLIGGSCYALVGAIGPPPEPPRSGSMELEVGAPLEFSGSGPAFCQIYDPPSGFSIYAQEGSLGTIDGRRLHASVDSFRGEPAQPGVQGQTPAPGGEGSQSININISLLPQSEADPPMEWFLGPETQLELDVASNGLSGTVSFEGLQAVEFEEPQPGAGEDSLSGTISWTCE
jgi:hypothetical protein